MKKPITRGEIYFADLSPAVGSEQGGRRPVLVVQNDTGNRHSTTLIVAGITSKIKPELPTHLPLSNVPGLHKSSVVLLEQLRTIDKQRLGRRVGQLNRIAMGFVDAALATSLALPQPHTIMTLCVECSRQFYDSGAYVLKRVDEDQPFKEPCTLCSIRMGYDYEVIKR